MSVKVMGQVWDLDLPPNEKLVLLAYTDHANHEGGNIYPAIKTVMQKTGYSERSVQEITRSLEQKGLLIEDGHGPKGTNKWRYGGAKIAPAKIAGVQNDVARGVQPTAPEPSINHPSENVIDSANQKVDAFLAMQLSPKAKARNEMVARIEKALRVTILDPDDRRWKPLIAHCLDNPDQPIEKYAAWMKLHPYDAPKVGQIAQRPVIIVETWQAAFTPEQAIQYEGMHEL